MLEVNIQKKLAHFLLDVQFSINREIVVLFGPSGSGKTTILNVLAGLSHPDAGKIELNKQVFFDGVHKTLPVQKRKIGYLFQDYALFPHLTVYKNILYGVKDKQDQANIKDIDSLIQAVGIEHLLAKFPAQISGGEKQRVALVRALATNPQLLLLDEPFSALDKETRLQCHDELLDLHQKWHTPILMVTHNLEEAEKLGDRILFIEKGKLTNG